MAGRKRKAEVSVETKAAKRAKKDDPEAFYFMGQLFSRGTMTPCPDFKGHKVKKVAVERRAETWAFPAHWTEFWRRKAAPTRYSTERKVRWFDPGDDIYGESFETPLRKFYEGSGRIYAIGGHAEDHSFEIVPRLCFEDTVEGALSAWRPINDDGRWWGVSFHGVDALPRCTFWLRGVAVEQPEFEEHESGIREVLEKEHRLSQPLCKIVLNYAWLDWRNIKEAVKLLRAPLLAECRREKDPGRDVTRFP